MDTVTEEGPFCFGAFRALGFRVLQAVPAIKSFCLPNVGFCCCKASQLVLQGLSMVQGVGPSSPRSSLMGQSLEFDWGFLLKDPTYG